MLWQDTMYWSTKGKEMDVQLVELILSPVNE